MKKQQNVTVKSLRAAGHLVKVTHLRRVSVSPLSVKQLIKPKYVHIAKGDFGKLPPVDVKLPQVILSRGGETQLTVDTKGGNHYQVNTICSRKEAYSKKGGLKVCLGRLVGAMRANGEAI